MANDGRRGPESSLHNGRMAPGHRSLNWKWSHGSRATSRAPGRVRRGTTAVSTAMKVDAVIVIVPLQTRIDAMDFKEMPPETNHFGNGGMGCC